MNQPASGTAWRATTVTGLAFFDQMITIMVIIMAKKDSKSLIVDLAKRLGRLEVTHSEAQKALSPYENPNKAIFDLTRQDYLIRVQRGFYRIHPAQVDVPPSSEVLSQMLYGPSYLSLEWALSHYQLIPERVESMTLVTLKKKKTIRTSVGTFEYQHLPKAKYGLGIREEKVRKASFLMATPLKAVVDLLYFRVDKKTKLSDRETGELLFEDFRIDPQGLAAQIKRQEILSFKARYRRVPVVKHALEFISTLSGGRG